MKMTAWAVNPITPASRRDGTGTIVTPPSAGGNRPAATSSSTAASDPYPRWASMRPSSIRGGGEHSRALAARLPAGSHSSSPARSGGAGTENPEPFAACPGKRLLQMLVDLRAHGHLTVGAFGQAHQRGEYIRKVARDRRAKLRAYFPGG